MNLSIFALEKLIKENEEKMANSKKQLRAIESGEFKVSALKRASVEQALEESTKDYEMYKKLYDDIPSDQKEQFKELEKVEEALAKQTYYKLQKIRMKKNKNLNRKQILEAMMILDELPNDIHFDDKQLIEVANTVIKNNIREVVTLEEELKQIKDEFEQRVQKIKECTDQKYFTLFDTYIPILIVHFKLFIEDIQESIEEHNENNPENQKHFDGLPKYEDWWLEELFKNHQAYFALYKWSSIIESLCMTAQQKIIWHKLFTNWVSIKKMLNSKEENSYIYTSIFDDMLQKYGQMEEEFDLDNLESMDKIIEKTIQKEDFSQYKTVHEINTTYLQYKQNLIKKNQ